MIQKYECHFKCNYYKICTVSTLFTFSKVTYEEIVKEVEIIDDKKSGTFLLYPPKDWKNVSGFIIVASYLIVETMK